MSILAVQSVANSLVLDTCLHQFKSPLLVFLRHILHWIEGHTHIQSGQYRDPLRRDVVLKVMYTHFC